MTIVFQWNGYKWMIWEETKPRAIIAFDHDIWNGIANLVKWANE